MFYSPDRKRQLAKLLEAFDSNSVIILIGSLDEEKTGIDFNLVSQIPPESTIEGVLGFMRHYHNETTKPEVKKSHLKVVED
jgi:hypothetical protein